MRSMMSWRRIAATSLAGLALATTAAVATTGTAVASSANDASNHSIQHACYIGLLTNVNQNTWVRQDPGFTAVLYTIPAGGGFRITGGPGFADGLWWWQGHGNGGAIGGSGRNLVMLMAWNGC